MPLDISNRETQLNEQRKNPVLTPCVGTPVQWFAAGGDEPQAAIVTKVESPGKISLTVFGPNAMPKTLQAVIWKKTPGFRKEEPTVFRMGAFDLPPHVQPPKAFFQPHIDQIDARLEALHREKQNHDANELARAERLKEKLAATA